MKSAMALAALAITAIAQQPGSLLGTPALLKLSGRTVQLMESTGAAVPGLARASAPLVESARQSEIALQRAPASGPALYALLNNLRAFQALADSMPKPFPFPEEGRRQLVELRESLDRLETHFTALLQQKETQLRTPDRDNLRRYAEANEKLSPPQPDKARVVFLGDSITDGWRLNEYFPERDFVNRGIGGQIAGEMLGRFKADVSDRKPEAVLLLAGTNDLARRVPSSTIVNNYAMIADLADHSHIKVIFASVLPVSDYHKDVSPRYEHTPQRPPAEIRALNDWLREFCSRRGYTYLDYHSALADEAGLLKAELADDGLHPNSAGYRVMAPLALEAIEKTLQPPQQKPKKKRLFSLWK